MNDFKKQLLKHALNLFFYDDTSPSCLRYKIDRRKRCVGDMAGSLSGSLKEPKRHWNVIVLGKKVKAHWVVWAIFNKEFPTIIDHIDGNARNNNISNLRLANNSTNQMNQKLRSDNSTGVKNVYFHKLTNKYHVRVSVNGNRKNLGYFQTLEEAAMAAKQAREEFHGEFARHE